jgi:hypothetical protein
VSPADEGDDAASIAPPEGEHHYYRGVITRVYYGSESGTLRSEESGREYRFKRPYVDIVGPIPRIDGLREGMSVGFDLGRASFGVCVTLIRVFD